jgi:hypothetical protein
LLVEEPKHVSDDEPDARLLAAAAGQLAAYLANPTLPPRVELLCLAAATQLPPATQTLPGPTHERSAAPELGPSQVLHTLSQLSQQIRATPPLLDAVADLNAASDALLAP